MPIPPTGILSAPPSERVPPRTVLGSSRPRPASFMIWSGSWWPGPGSWKSERPEHSLIGCVLAGGALAGKEPTNSVRRAAPSLGTQASCSGELHIVFRCAYPVASVGGHRVVFRCDVVPDFPFPPWGAHTPPQTLLGCGGCRSRHPPVFLEGSRSSDRAGWEAAAPQPPAVSCWAGIPQTRRNIVHYWESRRW